MGYHALRWEMILHGNAGELGKNTVLSVLPDKIARFLYEYHDTSYTSLGLPPIPLDRSGVFTASSSDQIRCNCAIYISYAKHVQYAKQYK
jgi:hypothetical protein